MPPGANQHANFILGLLEHGWVARRRGVSDALAGAVDLEVGLDRNIHETILRVAEYAALRYRYPDHRKRAAFNLEALSEGIRAAKQIVLDIASHHRHRGMMIVLNIREIAAGG